VFNARVAGRLPIPPLLRQLRDPLGLRSAARSPRSAALEPRTKSADRVARSVCPYCAVGCGQRVFVTDERVVQIEGDPDSPISRGRLCPKGAASLGYVTNPSRVTRVRYRPPHGTGWEDLDLETAMDMIADRLVATRASSWDAGANRTLGVAMLGGATLDSEENYLLKKSFTALGAVSIENQARI
jgi:formate dehydrogenase major subunit